jgi:broad specificity phosphatase PhoE
LSEAKIDKGRLLLVRHGETSANTDRVWHGQTDTPLTEVGQKQRARLGEYFDNYLSDVHAIYSSPLQRARLTAESIAEARGHRVNTDPRLMEFCAGEYEGKSFDELRDDLGFIQGVVDDEHHRAPGGETRFEVTQRFVTAVEEIRDNHPGDNIVVVAHGLAIAFALSHWIDKDPSKWVNYQMLNTSVTEICLVDVEIKFLNRTDHL